MYRLGERERKRERERHTDRQREDQTRGLQRTSTSQGKDRENNIEHAQTHI